MPDCDYCQDTGFLTRGMDVNTAWPALGADEATVTWTLAFVACSHPRASRVGREEPTHDQTVAVGARSRPEEAVDSGSDPLGALSTADGGGGAE